MSLRISIPKSAFSENTPIPVGWQKFRLGKPYLKTSKAGDSINYFVPHILENDPGERVIEHIFNSKGLEKDEGQKRMANFVASVEGKIVQEIQSALKTDTLEFDLEGIEGRSVLGKVFHSDFEGRIQSKIESWASPEKVPF